MVPARAAGRSSAAPPRPARSAGAVAELILGANPAVWMYASGASFSKALYLLGTPEQRRFAAHRGRARWTATMVLTEPDAGSDVGAGRTKAIAAAGRHLAHRGRQAVHHQRRARHGGEHLPPGAGQAGGAGPGTKGLSMFLVPKYLVDADGSLGERNGVYATNVEHKMGLKASTTCELTFGAEHPAVGTLVGDVHDGIRQMFLIIEHARMMVGTKAIATLSTGYLNALEFARTRVQGADLTQMTDKTAPRVTIIASPGRPADADAAEGVRGGHAGAGAVHRHLPGRRAARRGRRAAQTRAGAELNDLLLPVVKGVGSERAYEMLTLSLQTFGGSGFLQDYPIEQYIRDAKIDSLYEGTTAIQGLDLYFRKIVRDDGRALDGAARPDQGVRRGRGRQRPAEGGAGRAWPGRSADVEGDRDRHARLSWASSRPSPPRSTGSG